MIDVMVVMMNGQGAGTQSELSWSVCFVRTTLPIFQDQCLAFRILKNCVNSTKRKTFTTNNCKIFFMDVVDIHQILEGE